MALVDLDGRFMKVNQSLCEMTGYSESELLATTFHAITHPDDLAADVTLAKRLLAGEIRFYQLEKRYIHKQGQIVWILLSGSLVRDSQDQPLYFIAQIQDISDRKSTEDQLRQHQQHLQYLLTSSPAVIFSTQPDPNYKLTYISENVANILGYVAQEFLNGANFWLNHITNPVSDEQSEELKFKALPLIEPKGQNPALEGRERSTLNTQNSTLKNYPKAQDFVVIRITDNGCGMSEVEKKNYLTRFSRQKLWEQP